MEDSSSIVSDFYWSHRSELGRKKYHYLLRAKIFDDREVSLKMMGNYFGNLDEESMNKEIRSNVHGIVSRMNGKRKLVIGEYLGVLVREQLLVRRVFAERLFGYKMAASDVGRLDLKSACEDKNAIEALSSYAVNANILERYFGDRSNLLSTEELGEIWNGMQDNKHPDDKVYFWSHAVIAESHYYTRMIPGEIKKILTSKWIDLEEWIDSYYDELLIDSKLEFCLAGKMLGVESRLDSKILAESENYIGTYNFVVDPKKPRNFELAEHRSMLYLGIKRWRSL